MSSRRRAVRWDQPALEGKVLPREGCRININKATSWGRWRWNLTITGEGVLWCAYGALFFYSAYLQAKYKPPTTKQPDE
jgi:hypothetical protein